MSRILVLVVVFAVSVLAAAPVDAYCDAQRCVSRIKMLYTTSVYGADGTVFIGVHETPDEIGKLTNCVPFQNAITLKPSQPLFKELYSQLLVAANSGATLNLRVRETPGQTCELAYIIQTFE